MSNSKLADKNPVIFVVMNKSMKVTTAISYNLFELRQDNLFNFINDLSSRELAL